MRYAVEVQLSLDVSGCTRVGARSRPRLDAIAWTLVPPFDRVIWKKPLLITESRESEDMKVDQGPGEAEPELNRWSSLDVARFITRRKV